MQKFLVVLVALTLNATALADWPQWRGPARDGVAAGFTAPAAWPAQLTKKWEAEVGAGHSSPVIAGNRLIVHTRQGNREVVTAFDLATGKVLWQEGVDAPYTMNTAATGHGPGPKATPLVANGRVFTFGISGILSAHDLATGKLLWRKPATTPVQQYGTSSSPIADGANVIAFLGGNDAGALTAMDAATGAIKWQWTGDGPGYTSPILATIGGMRQIITQSQKKVIGVSASDGSLLWEVPLKTPYEQNIVTPLVVGDLLISSGLDNPTIGYWITAGLGKGWTATPRWTNDQVSMYMSSPAANGSTIFGLSNKNRGQFFAIDAKSGKTLWLGKPREAENASIVRAGNLLLLSTTAGELIVARPSVTALEEVKRYTVAESAMWAHPAFAGRSIVVKDVDKLIVWSY